MCVALFAGLPAFADVSKGWDAWENRDFATARREWLPLAKQGDSQAQYALGSLYRKGEGVPQDYIEALKWLRLSAEQGNPLGQDSLGLMYNKGYGVSQDYRKAAKWFRLAAEQNHLQGQYNLGVMYNNGHGVIQDYVLAHMWVNIAASNGYKDGVEVRDDLVKYMTPEQIAEAQKLARQCVKKNYKDC